MKYICDKAKDKTCNNTACWHFKPHECDDKENYCHIYGGDNVKCIPILKEITIRLCNAPKPIKCNERHCISLSKYGEDNVYSCIHVDTKCQFVKLIQIPI